MGLNVLLALVIINANRIDGKMKGKKSKTDDNSSAKMKRNAYDAERFRR